MPRSSKTKDSSSRASRSKELYTRPKGLSSNTPQSHSDDPEEFFKETFKNVVDSKLAHESSQYHRVRVFLLSWDEPTSLDYNIQRDNIANVKGVFENVYHFEIFDPDPAQLGWKIPLVNSHAEVEQNVKQMIGLDEPTTLNIVYYNGHGWQFNNELHWCSEAGQETVRWGGLSGIQQLLENARCHTLVLLDCCFAASVSLRPELHSYNHQVGPSWQMAACSYNTVSWTGPHSFTQTLVTQLHILAALPQGFAIQRLHSQIISYLSSIPVGDSGFTQAPILTLLTYDEKQQEVWLRPRTTNPGKLNYVDYDTTIGQFLRMQQPLLSEFGIWAYAWDSAGNPHATVALFDVKTNTNYISSSLVKKLDLRKEPISGKDAVAFRLFNGVRGSTIATSFVMLQVQLDASRPRPEPLEKKEFTVVNSDYGGSPFDLGFGMALMMQLDLKEYVQDSLARLLATQG